MRSLNLMRFRNRIGEKGSGILLKLLVELPGLQPSQKIHIVDTTAQEKNITFPTDTKLEKRVIERCLKLAKKAGLTLSRSFSGER